VKPAFDNQAGFAFHRSGGKAMIYSYGVSEQGTYHVKNNNIPCQDYHHIVKCGDDMVVAAVADGLGSAEHSDIASKIAATLSVEYCAKNIVPSGDTNDILDVIKKSFVLAQNSIENKAQENGHSINEYDTTLTLAVMRKNTLYYGHSGDSGIIALTLDGRYEQVTEQQRDEDDRVFPLFFKDNWIFRQYDKKVCSVLLATDGMFDTFFPFYIRNEPVNIHVSLARFFMDNRALRIDEAGEDKVKAQMKDFILNIPDEQVNDDKTIVVLVNASTESALQPEEYYKEPDWTELKRKHDEEWKRKAYPHLFKEKKTDNDEAPPDGGQSSGHVEKTSPEIKKQDTHVEATEKTAEIKENPKERWRKSLIEKLIEAIKGKQKSIEEKE
jgi:hypothetical protein